MNNWLKHRPILITIGMELNAVVTLPCEMQKCRV